MNRPGLVDFLLDRIAEDEQEARDELPNVVDSDFLFKWQPKRVLAECAAKRAIAEQAGEASSDRSSVISEFAVGFDEEREMRASDPGELILRHLAAVYADHPDYREEWR